ncbi:hypothetical protein [Labrys sp. ZIDIC5]|uniref:hypothetical protein n=1 Tax=Labrys sedimenti TaxID=3106036 RepID=UPI002ACC2375|nr:hypothetical protein [Labrys sp. ZIDIC5]
MSIAETRLCFEAIAGFSGWRDSAEHTLPSVIVGSIEVSQQDLKVRMVGDVDGQDLGCYPPVEALHHGIILDKGISASTLVRSPGRRYGETMFAHSGAG